MLISIYHSSIDTESEESEFLPMWNLQSRGLEALIKLSVSYTHNTYTLTYTLIQTLTCTSNYNWTDAVEEKHTEFRESMGGYWLGQEDKNGFPEKGGFKLWFEGSVRINQEKKDKPYVVNEQVISGECKGNQRAQVEVGTEVRDEVK